MADRAQLGTSLPTSAARVVCIGPSASAAQRKGTIRRVIGQHLLDLQHFQVSTRADIIAIPAIPPDSEIPRAGIGFSD